MLCWLDHYPFEDPAEPKNFHKTIHVMHYLSSSLSVGPFLRPFTNIFCCFLQRILNVQYSILDLVHVSPECRHLISRIFVADPAKVSTLLFLILEIRLC